MRKDIEVSYRPARSLWGQVFSVVPSFCLQDRPHQVCIMAPGERVIVIPLVHGPG